MDRAFALSAVRDASGRWADLPQWRVLDSNFEDGLYFLTLWNAWRADAARPQMLHVVAVLPQATPADPLFAASESHPALRPFAHELAAQWHGLLPGFHRLAFDEGRVLLTLCIGEWRAMLRAQHFEADDIVLPPGALQAPDAADLIKAVARFARRGTHLLAGAPAESGTALTGAMAQAGFQPLPDTAPHAVAGNGAPQMLHAEFNPPWTVRRRAPPPVPVRPGHCAVIGAGLAGAAVAASLARRGWRVTVFDAAGQPASGASSLPVGLLAPHVSPDDALLSRLTRAGIRATWQQLAQHLVEGTDWGATGVLERLDSAPEMAVDIAAEIETGIEAGIEADIETGGSPADYRLPPGWRAEGPNESWHATPAQLQAAHLPADARALWHARAAWVRPARLVAAWLSQPGIAVRTRCRIERLERHANGWSLYGEMNGAMNGAQEAMLAQADRVVIAAALDSAAFAAALPLQPVRGQVMWGHHAGLPATPVNGNGHLIAGVPDADGPLWLAGATFERDSCDTALRDADLHANRERLAQLHPHAARALASDFAQEKVNSWAGIRCASADRRPLVGPVHPAAGSGAQTQSAPDESLWLCAALGSRGLTFAALCAELLAARWHAEPLPLPAKLADALDTRRL